MPVEQNVRFLLVAFVLLTVGLLMPWVRLDDPVLRSANLEHVTRFASRDELPSVVRTYLDDLGLKRGVTPEEAWALFYGVELGANFAHVESHERLHIWHMLAFDTPLMLRLSVVVLLLVYVAAIVLLVAQWRGGRPSPSALPVDEEAWQLDSASWLPAEPDWEADLVDGRGRGRGRQAQAALAAAALLAFFLFVFELPYLDSLGYRGVWSMSMLDVVSGAKVTFWPRLFIPLGIVALMLAGAEGVVYLLASRGGDAEMGLDLEPFI